MNITLRLLVITDTFGTLVRNAIQENLERIQQCHALVLLGDLPATTYPTLRQEFGLSTMGFCVLGNHDGANWVDWLPRYKFQHLHTALASLRVGRQEIHLGGFSGSERYSSRSEWQWENWEASAQLKKLQPCDILISHTAAAPPEGQPEDFQHRGLPAIKHYIEKYQPRLALHGHFHQNYRRSYGKTLVIGCYGVVLVECTIQAGEWEIKNEPLAVFPGVAGS